MSFATRLTHLRRDLQEASLTIACVGATVLIAAAVYFFVVVPINWLMARMNKEPPPADPTTKKCPECLSEIPIEARRCAHCTQPQMGRAA